MPKSLADGHIKLSILTTKPLDPSKPTVTELNAGIDVSCDVLASDFTWSPTDSDKIAEKALCTTNNANAIGASNFSAGITLFRYFDATTKNASSTEDEGYAALKVKGTTVWGYMRETAKLSTEAWAAADEISLGLEVLTDSPQRTDAGGYIKRRIHMEPQNGWENVLVAAGS